MTPWEWPRSELVRVIDGDTFIASLTRDVGFHGTLTFEQKLRLARINAPPAGTTPGEIATGALQGIFTPFFLVVTTGPYKYGDEWMAEVTLPDGTNVSDRLVEAGVAAYWDGKGPRPGG